MSFYFRFCLFNCFDYFFILFFQKPPAYIPKFKLSNKRTDVRARREQKKFSIPAIDPFIGNTFDIYRVHKSIGYGEFGVVYLVYDESGRKKLS